ncbi:hypothetical protein J5N97_000988 [Dioscorea zingiberensis]|uniref:Uncharacterized protein n=1 Tax=Dioscorea zingiberensis TaxID=325984 RepID=A0A9D5BUK4_9LILI|nr:hypothetical protein J5N97_000988 [Dioscorea zingiberensis]
MSKLMKAPIRALSRARDFYVNSMTGCAGKVPYGSGSMGCPAAIPPRSFSYSEHRISASDDDLRELIRAASLSRRSPALQTPVKRSQSVAVGRIDEDSPCDFQDEVRVGSSLLFPRSMSCAVRARRISNLRVVA